MTDTISSDVPTGDDGDGATESPSERRPRTARTIALIVGVVLLLFIGLLATRKPAGDGPVSDLMLGKVVPRVEGTTLTGERFDIDAHRNRWVVVNFFASWCTPCREEHPELIRFSESHRTAGDAVVVSIAFGDTTDALDTFFAKFGGSWPVVVGNTGQAAIDFGVAKVPESFLVSPSGIVVGHFYGVTAQGLDDAIAQLSKPGQGGAR